MGLFNRDSQKQQSPLPPVSGPDYTIDTVRDYLQTIGEFRLQVRGADMKVALSTIAQHGEEYLMKQSPDGKPSGSQIVTLCEQLRTVRSVAEQYRGIESRLEYATDTTQELLEKGRSAVLGFAGKIASAVTPGGNANLTGYIVDTQILSM